MAAPTTSILDTFTRTDEPLSDSANWEEGTVIESGTSFDVVSNQVENVGNAGATSSGRWLGSDFGPDSEVFCEMVSADPGDSGDRYGIFAKVHNIGGSTTDGYGLSLRNTTGTIEFRMQRFDNEVDSDLDSPASVTMAAGDAFFLEIIGDQMNGYRRTGGSSWGTTLLTVTDSTYEAQSGSIGIYAWEVSVSVTPQLDDFGGGTVVVGGGGIRNPFGGPMVLRNPLGA